MAHKKGLGLFPIAMIGVGAVAGVLVYKNRDRISGFIDELTGNAAENYDSYEPEIEIDIEVAKEPEAAETDIVIDRSDEEPNTAEAPDTAAPSDAAEAPDAAEAQEEAPAEQPEEG